MKRVSLFLVIFSLAIIGSIVIIYTILIDNPGLSRIKGDNPIDHGFAVVAHKFFPRMALDWRFAKLLPSNDCKVSQYSNDLEGLMTLLAVDDKIDKNNFVFDFLEIIDANGVLGKCLFVGYTGSDGKGRIVYFNEGDKEIELYVKNVPKREI